MRTIIPQKKERGQSFVELAISLVFLLTLFAVMIDLGFAFYTFISLRDTAQEAASYGAICPFAEDGTRNVSLIRERLRLSATSPLDMRDIDANDIQVVFTDAAGTVIPSPGNPVLGGSVIVTVTIQHEILVPFVSGIAGITEYPITVTVANTVMRSKWLDKCDY